MAKRLQGWTWIQGPELPQPEPRATTRTIRGTALGALGFTAAYLVWRTTSTLNLSALWVSIPVLLLEIYSFFALAMFTFSLWDVSALPPAAPLLHDSNRRLAVLIPTYNESTEVLLPTVAAAIAMHGDHETWVLDDGDRPEVEALSTALGARYLTRPEHEHAKAGNLNHALAGFVDADIVAIFDADHVPDPDFFVKTLGYFDDPRLAVVQTPQEFYNASSFEHIDDGEIPVWDRQPVHEETLFYRVIQPAKNRWHAAFWCGTNAAVRVSAIRDIGGVPTESVTEDIHASVRLHSRGWRIVYHNEVLARGLAAANVEQFRTQRHRWATGGMQLLRQENPLFAPRLTIAQRMSYMATLMGWFDSWRSLAYLVLPIALIFTGASPIDAPISTFAIAFTITFVSQQLALSLLARGYHRPIASARFELMRLCSTIGATLTLLIPRSRTFKVTDKGRGGDERVSYRSPRDLRAILALSVVAATWFALTTIGVTGVQYARPGVQVAAMGWLIANGLLVHSAIRWIQSVDHATELRASVRFPLMAPGSIDGLDCVVIECSVTGARIEIASGDARRRMLVGTAHSHRLELQLNGGVLPLDVEVRTLRPSAGSAVQIGLELSPGQPIARAALAGALFAGNVAPVFSPAIVADPLVPDWDEAVLAS